MSAILWSLLLAAANPTAGNPQAEAMAWEIGKQLRCPVCQGMPVAESPSQMAQAMMHQVREMVVAGKSRDEIYAYFVERYGEWVLLEPSAQGFNLLVWLLPPLVLLLAGGGAVAYARSHRKQRPEASPAQPAPGPDTDDPYLQKIRQRVNS